MTVASCSTCQDTGTKIVATLPDSPYGTITLTEPCPHCEKGREVERAYLMWERDCLTRELAPEPPKAA